jgi:hypothetical protein
VSDLHEALALQFINLTIAESFVRWRKIPRYPGSVARSRSRQHEGDISRHRIPTEVLRRLLQAVADSMPQSIAVDAVAGPGY